MKAFALKFFLLFIVTLWCSINARATKIEVDGLHYRIYNNTVWVIRFDNYKDKPYGGDIIIPSEVSYNGSVYAVRGIDNKAFQQCLGLKSITIPSTVTVIEGSSFVGCENLESVSLPNSIVSIGGHAFEGCKSLKTFVVPDSVTNIGISAFENCKLLNNIKLGKSISEIQQYAFEGCLSLVSITIPNSVNWLAMDAFDNCPNLISMTIEDGGDKLQILTSDKTKYIKDLYLGRNVVGRSAFFGLSHLENLKISSSVTEISDGVFSHIGKLKEVIIPSSVKKIGYDAFLNSTIDSLVIGKNVEEIGNFAFNCSLGAVTSLRDVPPSTKDNTFRMFSNAVLRVPKGSANAYKADKNWKFWYIEEIEIDVEKEDGGETKTDMIFEINGIQYKTISQNTVAIVKSQTNYSGDFVIPKSVEFGGLSYNITSIGDSAFYSCTNLSSINIGNYITDIGIASFGKCSSLKSLVIGNSVNSINKDAFIDCDNINKIEFNCQTVTSWFNGFKSLQHIIIGANVQSISQGAFVDCHLQDVQIQDLESWCNIDFGYETETASGQYLVRKGEYVNYSHSNILCTSNPLLYTENIIVDGSYVTDLVLPDNIKTIKAFAFYGGKMLTSITLSKNLEIIGLGAFENCEKLNRITFGDKISSIGSCAFTGCKKLQSIHLSSIAAWCNVKFSRFRTSIEYSSHNQKETFDEYSNPLRLTSNLYYNNELITNLVIPEGVKSIDENTFWCVSSITSISFPSTVTKVSSSAFTGCNNIDSLTFYCKVVNSWFGGVKKIVFDSNVESIENDAFSTCSLISIITLNTTPPQIGNNTFNETAYKNATLYVPKGCKSVYSQKTYWENFKNIVELDDTTLSGDANSDGTVNAADIVEVVNYIMGNPSDKFVKTQADANEDGIVNVADIVKIVNEIMK